MLASGVFLSGFVKDMLCLPRPLSPPLTRITMSGSAALEYGFPSTHSTNAVSVAVYLVLAVSGHHDDWPSKTIWMLQGLACFYATSIVVGRLYCGMHGFFDVIVGSALGALIAIAQFHLGPKFDDWLFNGSTQNVVIVALTIFVLVRIHPEPADNCPCFDDSVAFAGVVLGCEAGGWHFSQTQYAVNDIYPSTAPFDLRQLGWAVTIARIIIGVVSIFTWRAIMKPFLLRFLPPVFRVIEDWGLDLPRRFFKPASQYKRVPKQEHDDNIIPAAKEIPNLLTNFRRRRAISVGPQSEADAYEALAYREKRRKDSLSRPAGMAVSPVKELSPHKELFSPDSTTANNASHSRKRSLSLEEFRAQMGGSLNTLSPLAVDNSTSADLSSGMPPTDPEYIHRTELFASIQKPRVRYDVEVVTKLIVYTGIALLAVEGNPILFHHLGLVPVD